MKYEWTEGYRDKIEPEIVAEELKRIEKDVGFIDANIVVKEAAKKKSPIHDVFQWDDSIAAHEFRLTQARTMIRSLRVVVEEEDKPKRLYWHSIDTQKEESRSVYVIRDRISGDVGLRESTYNEVVKQLKGIRSRYAEISELKNIWEQIDEL